MTIMQFAGQTENVFDNRKGSRGPTAITKLEDTHGKPDHYLVTINALNIVGHILRFSDIGATYAENKLREEGYKMLAEKIEKLAGREDLRIIRY